MSDTEEKIFIGFITYGNSTAKYLPYFLPSLLAQTYDNIEIIVFDNSNEVENENEKYLKKINPDIKIIRKGKNVGFAKAYNVMIDEAKKQGANYFLALNPDTVLDENFLEEAVNTIKNGEKIGAIAPRIYSWDFCNKKKTELLDSCGLCVNESHRFFEFNQGKKCQDCSHESAEVFGFTGAAVLFKMEALCDVVFVSNNGKNEYFDELMFMYKEDCDLSYRIRLAGWKIISAPKAKVYHDRTVKTQGNSLYDIVQNRKNKNRDIKRWSFLNHWIIILKYKRLKFPLKVKLATFYYQLKSMVFVLFFEPYLLRELKRLWDKRAEIEDKRKALKVNIDMKEINKFLK